MTIHRPIHAPIYRPVYPPIGGGLPWEVGGGAPAVAPSAPTIAGTMARGQTIAITPGVGGGPVTSFTLFRDGTAVPTQTAKPEATIEARLLVDVDIGAAITVKANGPGGSSAHSNTLQYKPGTHANGVAGFLADADQITLTSTKVSAWADQSANANTLVQGTAGLRPTMTTINGRDAIRFTLADNTRLRNAALVGLGGSSPEMTLLIVGQYLTLPATRQFLATFDDALGPGYWYVDNAVTVAWPAAVLGSLSAQYATAPATDSLVAYIARRSNVSTNTTKLRINNTERASATGALAAMSSATPAIEIGGYPGSLFSADVKIRAFAIFNDDLSDSATLDLAAYAANVLSSAPSWSLAPRVRFDGDSLIVGTQGDTGGWRPSCLATCVAAGLTYTAVGPSDNFGLHRGVGGETGRSVVLASGTYVTRLLVDLPDIVVVEWAINDMIAGSFDAAATIQMRRDITAIIRDALPLTKVIHTSCVRWTGYAPGAAFLGECDTFNADMPAAAAAMGCAYVDLGAPARSDFVHPTDPAYAVIGAGVMASAIIATAGG